MSFYQPLHIKINAEHVKTAIMFPISRPSPWPLKIVILITLIKLQNHCLTANTYHVLIKRTECCCLTDKLLENSHDRLIFSSEKQGS